MGRGKIIMKSIVVLIYKCFYMMNIDVVGDIV